MPNYVSNEIRFAPMNGIEADMLAERLKLGQSGDSSQKIDFENYIPPPPHMYRGSLSDDDETDFPCNWLNWSRANWGTKWNASYSDWAIEELEDGTSQLVITFSTAWSVPYPIISAINEIAQLPFVHKYFDEGECFWGIEEWGPEAFPPNPGRRLRKRYADETDLPHLRELFGYDNYEEQESKE